MTDLTTTYLGLNLKNPLVASASPLSKKVDTVRKLEDAGASAVVLYSLFEEQIVHESHKLSYFLDQANEPSRESNPYYPDLDHYNVGPDGYLEHIQKVKKAVSIPVIASGGAGTPEHLYEVLTAGRADAALIASMVHYGTYSIQEIKDYLRQRGIPVRLHW